MRIGVLPLARVTFDLDAATRAVEAARAVLEGLGHTLVGPLHPETDEARVATLVDDLVAARPDAVVVLQGTFTTATAVEKLTANWPGRVVLWGFPEPPGSDRLRLNSLCGITLASYTLTRRAVDVRPVHGDPADPRTAPLLEAALTEPPLARTDPIRAPRQDLPDRARLLARRTAAWLYGARIGRLGEPPDGFEPCTYDADPLRRHLGVVVDERNLDTLFDAATKASADSVGRQRDLVNQVTTGVDDLDGDGVERSVRLLLGMRDLVGRNGWTAVATRCWPECMTGFGGAVCWPSAVLADEGVPAGCEADVLGTVTNLVLQHLADRPAFLADLVDIDHATDTGVLWHCGVAAASMARDGVPVHVSNHPNRPVPMVHDFGLAPGRLTLARLTRRPSGELVLVIGGGTALDTDRHLRGTSAVVRFDHPVTEVVDRVLGDGLDHHVSIVYGDVRDELEGIAAEWGIGVIDL
jgi:hypothetical protein